MATVPRRRVYIAVLTMSIAASAKSIACTAGDVDCITELRVLSNHSMAADVDVASAGHAWQCPLQLERRRLQYWGIIALATDVHCTCSRACTWRRRHQLNFTAPATSSGNGRCGGILIAVLSTSRTFSTGDVHCSADDVYILLCYE